MNESMERVLADWLREGPERGPSEGLERTLAATRRVGQRPGWTLPERWLPMELTMIRTPERRPLLMILALALLVLTVVATFLVVGSRQPSLPAPFGPARNGAIVFEREGDLHIADALDAPARTLVAGPGTDAFPVFANQGDRLAFIRSSGAGFQLMSVQPDGSGLMELASFPGGFDGFRWSPDGQAILINFTETGYPADFRLAIVDADGTGSRAIDVGRAADWASWRPDGRHIAFRGQLEDGTSGAFIADADGTNVRRLPMESGDPVDFEGLAWSPDGTRLSFMSGGALAGTTMRWQIGIADIATDGTLTGHRYIRLDEGAGAEMLPAWSPDGSQLAYIVDKGGKRQIAIAPADGSAPPRLVGPTTPSANGLAQGWSPDGRTVTITIFPTTGEETFWSVDVATGETTELDVRGQAWQRLGS
jgi:Tol biopolymer transport system component